MTWWLDQLPAMNGNTSVSAKSLPLDEHKDRLAPESVLPRTSIALELESVKLQVDACLANNKLIVWPSRPCHLPDVYNEATTSQWLAMHYSDPAITILNAIAKQVRSRSSRNNRLDRLDASFVRAFQHVDLIWPEWQREIRPRRTIDDYNHARIADDIRSNPAFHARFARYWRLLVGSRRRRSRPIAPIQGGSFAARA